MNQPDSNRPGLYSRILLAELRDRLPRPVRVRWGSTGACEEVVKTQDRLDQLLRSLPMDMPYSLDEIHPEEA